MSLDLDLNLLESDEKFQQLCFRLALKGFPDSVAVAHGSWDGGRDIVCFNTCSGDIVWQCKFTRRSLSSLKTKIVQSLDALDPGRAVSCWVLCVSVDGSGRFLDWLRETISAYPFVHSWKLWDRTAILRRLEEHPDIMEVFFFSIWKQLEQKFRTDELELLRYRLNPHCGWRAPDPSILKLYQNSANSDLVLDIIVRSRGTLQSLLSACKVELSDVRPHLRGLPGTALLYSQHTYTLSLRGGRAGSRIEELEPPLTVDAGAHQRFSLKLTETGYAWTGFLSLAFLYGNQRQLLLPTVFLRS